MTVFLVIFLSIFALQETSARGATFTCTEGSGASYDRADAWIDGLPTDRPYCRVAVMVGAILPGDHNEFNNFLRREPYVRYLKAHSPGGSVAAAMDIGRLIRSRFINVWTADHETDTERRKCGSLRYAREALQNELLGPPPGLADAPLVTDEEIRADEQREKARREAVQALVIDPERVRKYQENCRVRTDCRIGGRCCASACVLVFAGSVNWNARNLGLHRPSLSDLSPRGYEDVTSQLSRAKQAIYDYLVEMGVPRRVFEAMMQVPPDEVRMLDQPTAWSLLFGIKSGEDAQKSYELRLDAFLPPSVYDWVIRECPEMRFPRAADSMTQWRGRQQREGCIADVMDREFLRRASQSLQ